MGDPMKRGRGGMIAAHGSVTHENASSAAKRVIGRLKVLARSRTTSLASRSVTLYHGGCDTAELRKFSDLQAKIGFVARPISRGGYYEPATDTSVAPNDSAGPTTEPATEEET